MIYGKGAFTLLSVEYSTLRSSTTALPKHSVLAIQYVHLEYQAYITVLSRSRCAPFSRADARVHDVPGEHRWRSAAVSVSPHTLRDAALGVA